MVLGKVERYCVTENMGVVFPFNKCTGKWFKELSPGTGNVLAHVWRVQFILWIKLIGVSNGEAPVRAAISEAPMVFRLALTHSSLRCRNPVCRSFKKARKASTLAISGRIPGGGVSPIGYLCLGVVLRGGEGALLTVI